MNPLRALLATAFLALLVISPALAQAPAQAPSTSRLSIASLDNSQNACPEIQQAFSCPATALMARGENACRVW